jgi:hypothetical protein
MGFVISRKVQQIGASKTNTMKPANLENSFIHKRESVDTGQTHICRIPATIHIG